MLGRDVVAVGREPTQVGGALLHQRQPPVREVGRDLHPHIGHQAPALAHQRAHVVEADGCGPGRGGQLVARPALARRSCARARRALAILGFVGDLRRFGPVVAGMGHEVLQDDLLDVAVLALQLGQRLQRLDALGRGLADAHQDPAGEGNAQLAGGPDRLQSHRRVLGGRALVDHQLGVDRLQHQALRGGDLAQPGEVLARERTEVGVRQHAPLQRTLTGPRDVGGEVGVTVLRQPRRHLGVDLGPFAGEHEQLLRAAAGGVVEDPLDLRGRVEVRPVRRERAVLAVALTGPRQREREIA